MIVEESIYCSKASRRFGPSSWLCELTDRQFLGIITNNIHLNHCMTWELQSTLVAFGIECPALRNHTPCIARVMQLAPGAFMSTLCGKGCAKSWEAHERNQHFEENESIDIGKSQRLQKEGKARINKLSAMSAGLAKIFQKVHSSRHFESAETDLRIAGNACRIDYADTRLSKRLHWLSNNQSINRNTTYSGWGNTMEFDTGVPWESLPIMIIHPQVP